jgi:hypothetical protein
VRIEFCEADVLDVFDEWRRAVGVTAWSGGPEATGESTGDVADADGAADGARRSQSLPAHLERVIARLTALRGSRDSAFDDMLDTVVRELDTSRGTAKALRGAAREGLLVRLRALDEMLIAAVRPATGSPALAALAGEADAELEPFKARMTHEAYEQSRQACVDRLLRERARLPIVAFE